MKKILLIREAVEGGINNYCKMLMALFQHSDSYEFLPLSDIETLPSRLFHYYYRPSRLKAAIQEADIVQINGYTAMGTVQALVMAKRLGKKVVYSPHWHPFQHLRHPVLGKWFFRVFLQPVIKRCADCVVTINKEDTQFFQVFHPNVVQIPHCLLHFEPQELNARRPADKQKQKKMLLFVGRLNDPVKGLFHLYSLPEGLYDIHCVGRGTLEERSDITPHINASDQELDALYSQADLVVVPSKYEAFSYTTLEALLHATPVVISERVRIGDYLENTSGVSVFQYGNTKEFAEKISQTIGQAVDLKQVQQLFSPTRIQAEYQRVYNELMQNV